MSTADLPAPVRALFVQPLGEQLKMLEVWTQEGRADWIQEVAHSEGSHRELRKAAKKALHVLRARGVAISERAPSAPSPALKPAVPSQGQGWMTPVDGAGGQLLLASYPAASSGVVAVQLIADWHTFRLEGSAFHTSKKKLKGFVDEATSSQGIRLYGVPVDYARMRITDALGEAQARGVAVPQELLDADLILPPPPAARVPHPFGPLEPAEPRPLVESEFAILESDPVVAGWTPSEKVIHELLERLEASSGGSLLVLSEAQKDEAQDSVLRRTIDETVEHRLVWAATMRDTAYCLREAGEVDRSALLIRASREVEDEARPASDVAFFRWLYRHPLSAHQHHHHHSRPGDGPRHREDEGRTPGGLILP